MDTMNVAGYGAQGTAKSVDTKYQATGASGSYATWGNQTTGNKTLGIDDFLQLMVAQMQNQDPMQPQDNTAFVAQMAQFSSLQAMTDMSKTMDNMKVAMDDLSAINATQYGASLMGKKVKLSYYDKDGKIQDTQGTVNTVIPPSSTQGALISLAEEPGKLYHLANVMEIVTEFKPDTPETPETPDTPEAPEFHDPSGTVVDGAGGAGSGKTAADNGSTPASASKSGTVAIPVG